MLRWARGLVCMPCAPERLDKLGLAPMVPPEHAGCDTAFTVSIDHVEAGSGIGAADRALTIRRAVDPDASPHEFKRPGHVFPLRARPGGTLERRGPHRGRGGPGAPRRAAAGRGDLRGAGRRRLPGPRPGPRGVRGRAPHRHGHASTRSPSSAGRWPVSTNGRRLPSCCRRAADRPDGPAPLGLGRAPSRRVGDAPTR